jgi:DNA modification methylase
MVVNQVITDKYSIFNGDCIEVAEKLTSNSIHYSMSSIPFASLYTYSNSERDLGNCKTYDEFEKHFAYMIEQWHRVTMPGRLVSIHCMNLPTSKQNHGYIGLQDFRGDIIRWFQKVGFIYHSEVCIWKDPVIAMQRTKALGLLHKQIKKDSAMSRQGIPDYLITFRKDGNNPEPVSHTNESFPVAMWQRYADPVWVTKNAFEDDGFYKLSMDINPSDTLQKQSAREQCDERHICPLQLQVIERGIQLWSNPNDVIYDPFGGIGSTGYIALKIGRRALMTELKESYYRQMELNMASVKPESKGLFD